MEDWRKVEGFNYEVSNSGKVRSMRKYTTWQSARELKPQLRKGYYFVALMREGERFQFNVHRLVAIAFLGKSDLTVNHIDGNKLNNNVSNLEWCSMSENRKHAFRTGLQKYKQTRKLDYTQAYVIRSLKGLITNRLIAKYFNIRQQTVSDIQCGKRWPKLTITKA